MILLIDKNTNQILSIYCDNSYTPITKDAYSIKIDNRSIPIKENSNLYFLDGEIVSKEKQNLDKEYLLSKISTDYENSVSQLTSSIPISEISTWTKQEQEARNYLLDNNANTPFMDAICTSRGVDKSYLAGKIIEKADAYAVAVGTLTGIRQKLEKEILGE